MWLVTMSSICDTVPFLVSKAGARAGRGGGKDNGDRGSGSACLLMLVDGLHEGKCHSDCTEFERDSIISHRNLFEELGDE
uniref:Secreted protein n=1 Tax=Loa loa TaxID=7209 RepID=A0A1I7VIJ7_LOALO